MILVAALFFLISWQPFHSRKTALFITLQQGEQLTSKITTISKGIASGSAQRLRMKWWISGTSQEHPKKSQELWISRCQLLEIIQKWPTKNAAAVADTSFSWGNERMAGQTLMLGPTAFSHSRDIPASPFRLSPPLPPLWVKEAALAVALDTSSFEQSRNMVGTRQVLGRECLGLQDMFWTYTEMFFYKCFCSWEIFQVSHCNSVPNSTGTWRLNWSACGWHLNCWGPTTTPPGLAIESDTLTNPMIKQSGYSSKMNTRDRKSDHVKKSHINQFINQFRVFLWFFCIIFVDCIFCMFLHPVVFCSWFNPMFPPLASIHGHLQFGAMASAPAETSTPEPVPDHLAQHQVIAAETFEKIWTIPFNIGDGDWLYHIVIISYIDYIIYWSLVPLSLVIPIWYHIIDYIIDFIDVEWWWLKQEMS